MNSSENSVNLTIQLIPAENTDSEELDRQTRQLLAEIQELDVKSAELVKGGEPPEGAKAADLVALSTLAIAVLPALAPKLIEFVQSWSMRAKNQIIKIKTQIADRSIEVEYNPATMSTDELTHLVKSILGALPSTPVDNDLIRSTAGLISIYRRKGWEDESKTRSDYR